MRRLLAESTMATMAIVATLPVPLLAQPANTPWPMFRHDAQRTGQSQYTAPRTAALLWSYITGDPIYSSAVIDADGGAFIGSRGGISGSLYALSSTGSLAWSFYTNGYEEHIYSSPALGSDGSIYFRTSGFSWWSGSNSRFYAITSPGVLRWSYTTWGGGDSSPVISPEGMISVAADHTLYSFEGTGTLMWSYETDWDLYESPAIGIDGNVIIGSGDNFIYSLTSAGVLRWSYATADEVQSSPAIDHAGHICIGSDDTALYSLKSDGSLFWSYKTGTWVRSSPAISSDATIYVNAYDDGLYSIESMGELRWSYANVAESCASLGSDGMITVRSWDMRLSALSSFGSLEWSYVFGVPDFCASSPSIGSKGKLIIGSGDGIFCFYDPTPTPTPLPQAVIVLNGSSFGAGDPITAIFELNRSIERAFTVYAVLILPDGSMLDTITLHSTLKPIASNMPGLSAPFSYTLLSTQIHACAPRGYYELVTAFFDPGKPITRRGDAFLDVSSRFSIQ